MNCVHINIPNVILLFISFILNNIQQTQMADNHMDLVIKDLLQKNTTSSDAEPLTPKNKAGTPHCPSDTECSLLEPPCIECDFNADCVYGQPITVKCKVDNQAKCKGDKTFERSLTCRYCYQTELWEHWCDLKTNCNAAATPRAYYRTNCSARGNVLCLGHRRFFKNIQCNWTAGYRWSTALVLSVTLGGLGADRFYLGHWQEGIGKLFSFGGLGVWTLVDVILISIHYLGPANGSLYI